MVLIVLISYNGVGIYDDRLAEYQIFLSVSLSGLGGCYDQSVYCLPIPPVYKGYDIVHLEIVLYLLVGACHNCSVQESPVILASSCIILL